MARQTKVAAFNTEGEYLGTFDTSKQASEELDIHRSHISRILNGELDQVKSHTFVKMTDEMSKMKVSIKIQQYFQIKAQSLKEHLHDGN